jgi:hypothetical protein
MAEDQKPVEAQRATASGWRVLKRELQRSINYEDERMNFFLRAKRVTLFFGIVAELLAIPADAVNVQTVVAFAVSGGLLLAASRHPWLSNAAAEHAKAKLRYCELFSAASKKRYSPDELTEIRDKMLEQRARHPPHYRIMDILARNAAYQAGAETEGSDHIPVGCWERLLANIIPFSSRAVPHLK